MKWDCVLLILCMIFCGQCRKKESGIVHDNENGIDVVSNPLHAPSKAKVSFKKERALLSNAPGIPGDISFGRIFSIADDDTLYLCDAKNTSILIFNAKGEFVKQFGGPGEGPGLFMDVRDILFSNEEIVILEESRCSYFSKNGTFLRQTKLPVNYAVSILSNGYILTQSPGQDQKNQSVFNFQLKLNSFAGKPLQLLDTITMFNPRGSRIKGINYSMSVARSKDNLFVYSQDRQYEIWMYDFSGRLVRRIKKAYEAVPVSEEYRENFISEIRPLYELIKDKLFFPEYMPPIHCLFADEEGFLFAVTYEKSKNKDGYIVDVYDAKGEYIAQTVMPLDSLVKPAAIRLKNRRIYQIFQKIDEVEEFSISSYSIYN